MADSSREHQSYLSNFDEDVSQEAKRKKDDYNSSPYLTSGKYSTLIGVGQPFSNQLIGDEKDNQSQGSKGNNPKEGQSSNIGQRLRNNRNRNNRLLRQRSESRQQNNPQPNPNQENESVNDSSLNDQQSGQMSEFINGHNGDQEEDQELSVERRRSRRSRRSNKKIEKDKNISKVFKSKIVKYIKLKSQGEVSQFVKKFAKIENITLEDFTALFRRNQQKELLRKMFQERWLNTQLQLTRSSNGQKNKKQVSFYIKRISVFRKALERGQLKRIN